MAAILQRHEPWESTDEQKLDPQEQNSDDTDSPPPGPPVPKIYNLSRFAVLEADQSNKDKEEEKTESSDSENSADRAMMDEDADDGGHANYIGLNNMLFGGQDTTSPETSPSPEETPAPPSTDSETPTPLQLKKPLKLRNPSVVCWYNTLITTLTQTRFGNALERLRHIEVPEKYEFLKMVASDIDTYKHGHPDHILTFTGSALKAQFAMWDLPANVTTHEEPPKRIESRAEISRSALRSGTQSLPTRNM